MLTVTQLARAYGISRATVLYYERQGLLQATHRDENRYRLFGQEAQDRLSEIMAYRSYGLPIAQIRVLLDKKAGESQSQILREHFNELGKEINALRKQQKAIVALLQEPALLEDNMVTKDRWVEIMRASGLDEAAMTRWHQNFEQMEPDEHQKFLESLNIDAAEIKQIRAL